MNHRERRNFLGEKKPEQNLWVTPSTVKLPCSTPWIASSSKSGASMLWSRSPVSQLLWIKDTPAANWKKKNPPQVTNTGTWPDHPMGTETGRWQKQKLKQKKASCFKTTPAFLRARPPSHLKAPWDPCWEWFPRLGCGGVHGVEPVELLRFWTLGDSWWILGALGEPPPNSSQNWIITQPPAGRECPAVTSESPQHRKTIVTSIHC